MKKFFFSLFLISITFIASASAQPSIWTVNSRADVLKGDARGVSIDENGAITNAPKLTEIYKTGQPYIWSSVIDSGGNVYLGTGGEGRIYRVGTNGTGAIFSDLAELNVSALAVAKSGDLFAGTSPDGKVYKVDVSGKAEVYFDPKEKYIWSLAVMADGSLAVGTGDGGKIYRVRSASATPESSLLFDTSETHIITLATDKSGNLFAGTDSNGLVLRFGSDGKPFALLDSPLREIHEIAIGPDGSAYVLALGDSASAAKPEATPKPPDAAGSKAVKISRSNTPPQPTAPQKSKYDLTGAKSSVYRILPDGGTDILWSSPTVVGFSIYAHQTGRGVLLGTSDKGRIYNITNEGRATLILQSEVSQISTIFSSGSNLYAASSNQGNLFRIGPDLESEGVYESAVLDAETTGSWGNIWWRSSGNVLIETRSGNTEDTNETWSGWEIVLAEAKRGKIASPKARFVQWRAKMKNATPSASLTEVNLAFVARNIAPEILSINALPANVGLLANPPMQIDPNIELSGIDPSAFGIVLQPIQPRRAYQRGARAFQWTAEDRNGDKIVYDVFFKEANDSGFKILAENINETFYSIDGLSLADGSYTLKIVAKDSLSNPAGQQMSGERISETFLIDNTQPTVRVSVQPQITGDKGRVTFLASDSSSYLTRAEYSVNGGAWMSVYADDGISDGPEERYTVEISMSSPGEFSVTLRVFDVDGNVGNARAVIKR
jgi:hypothetical protein